MYLYNAHRETISMVLISQNSDTFEGHSHFTNEKNWDSEANWLDSDLSLDFSRSLIYIAINSSIVVKTHGFQNTHHQNGIYRTEIAVHTYRP